MKIHIYKKDDGYGLELTHGVQHFHIDYVGNKKEVKWYAKQLRKMILSFAKDIINHEAVGDIPLTMGGFKYQQPNDIQ